MEAALQSESGDKTPEKIASGEICRQLKAICAAVTVEPVLFCYSLPANMLFTATQNFNLVKACSVNLNYNATVCQSLTARNKSGYNTTEEQTVQALVASVNGYSSFLQGFLICITLLIVGSWSDKNHKRKPLLMIPLIGDIISALLLLVSLCFYEQLPVEFNAFAEAVPQGLAGGWFCMITAAMAYISEDPDVGKRTTRLRATSVMFLFAAYSGLALGGLLFNKIKLYQVYTIIIAIHSVGMAYTYFRVEEVRYSEETHLKTKNRVLMLDVLNLGHIKKTFQFLCVDDSRKKRRKIWFRLIAMWASLGPWYGIPFWLTFFTKILKVDHSIVGVLSTMPKIVSAFVYMFAPNAAVFYLGVIIEVINAIAIITLRTVLTKMVSPTEQGKLAALTELTDVVAMFVYGSLYSMVYRATLGVFPGTFYILSATVTAFPLGMFIWLSHDYKRNKREAKEEQMVELLEETVPNSAF